MAAAIMIFNYFHDLAVAILGVNIMVVYFLGKYLDDRPFKDEIIPHLFRKLSKITYGALAFIVVGGFVRAVYFMEVEWNAALGNGIVGALIAKHIVLVSITIFGIVVHRRYVRKYGRS